jgi:hypothetical protein
MSLHFLYHIKTLPSPFQNERVFLLPKTQISAKAFIAKHLAVFKFTGTDFGIKAVMI